LVWISRTSRVSVYKDFALLSAGAGVSTVGSYKGYSDPSLVVDVDTASKMLGRRNTVFVDTRNYWKYVRGHIPNAFNLELYAFHWVDTSRLGLNLFAEQMATLFSAIGVDESKEVIFYQNNSGYDAARGVWLLHFLGQNNARILDGGFNLWKRKGFAVSVEDPDTVSPSQFKARLDDSVVATRSLILRMLKHRKKGGISSEPRILDVRKKGEYEGNYRRALKAGHIPGSVNVEWKLALRKDGTLKTATGLRRLYRHIRLGVDDEIVTYCQSGYRAAHSWLILRLLGYTRVRNYLGSWYEWGNNPANPVTTA
jgi:thiosulfate/3-mercaptopyruvate sulfurtransferase